MIHKSSEGALVRIFKIYLSHSFLQAAPPPPPPHPCPVKNNHFANYPLCCYACKTKRYILRQFLKEKQMEI